MFGVKMNGSPEGRQSELSGGTRNLHDDERCRLDMDPRLTKRSVRFGEESMSLSGNKREMEHDSEEPSESEMDATLRDDRIRQSASNMEDDDELAESTFDPRLEQKIEQIKNNLRSGSQSNSQTVTQAGLTSNDDSNIRNVRKLEEVL